MKWYVANDGTKQAIRTESLLQLPEQLRGKFHPATLEEYSRLRLYEIV